MKTITERIEFYLRQRARRGTADRDDPVLTGGRDSGERQKRQISCWSRYGRISRKQIRKNDRRTDRYEEEQTEIMSGTFTGAGVGPGDPELMTLKAVRAIRECSVIAVPVSDGELSEPFLRKPKGKAGIRSILSAAWRTALRGEPCRKRRRKTESFCPCR